MTSLQIRDVPDEVMKLLRETAQANHRSVSQETLVILEEGLGFQRKEEPVKTREQQLQERKEQLDRIWAELDEINKDVKPIPREVRQQIYEECREERDRRGIDPEIYEELTRAEATIKEPVFDYIIKVAV